MIAAIINVKLIFEPLQKVQQFNWKQSDFLR